MKAIIKDALILFAITLIAGLALGFVHKIKLMSRCKDKYEYCK
jgi:hypothetical protein